MRDEEPTRLLQLLAEVVARSGRTQRDIERGLGVGHGWLRNIFKGATDLKVQHILDLGRLLGFTPAQFFRQAYPLDEGSILDQVRPEIEDIFPSKKQRGQLTAIAQQQVRSIFRDELARYGILPPALGSRASGMTEDEDKPKPGES